MSGLTITEPRFIPAAELPAYVGWTLQPELSAGAMISGRILAAHPLEGDDSAMVITLESRDGRGRYIETAHVLTTWRPDFQRRTSEARYVEVCFAHSVPDSVPGRSASERYSAVFDRVDARGMTIAAAIASLAAEGEAIAA